MRRIAVLALVLSLFGAATAPARAEMAPDQKREIERIVRDYILANPEVVEKALMALDAKRQQEQAAAQARAVHEMRDTILNSAHQAVVGNPEGKVTLVEFFDYNCGYCKRALPDLMALIQSNPDLRVVMKEFPILSEGSVEAARISVAVKEQTPKRYLEFHRELLGRPGQADRAKALQVARDLGLDAKALERAAKDKAVDENLIEVQQLAHALGIGGTPSYVVGDELVFGAVGFDQLQEKIAAERKACAGETAC
ncbi:DsbA family protein [Propylenella binzhouense]|uniref:DsbA family protein n=1 Tax=Propylenella binzhouense TaxID=2555902 RepID=A0A964WVC9_9HYPH|nr:DsbA family protein [Propylenella binzhouense]MYZ49685.1 DsbA family protein [Propylenella binzhouense]